MSTSAQFTFAAEFVAFLAAAAGLALVLLRGDFVVRPPWTRVPLGAGFALVASAAFLRGSLLVETAADPRLLALRAVGVAVVAASSVFWRDGGVARQFLWVGLIGVAGSCTAHIEGSVVVGDALLVAGSVIVLAAVLTASRRSLAARVAGSAAGVLLLMVLVLSLALSAVLSSTVEREAARRLDARGGTEVALLDSESTDATLGARLTAQSIAISRGQLLFELASAPQRSSRIDDDLSVLSGKFLSGLPLAYFSVDGTVLGATGFDPTALAPIAASDAFRTAQESVDEVSTVAAVRGAAVALGIAHVFDNPSEGARKVLGTVVAARLLDDGYLRQRTSDDISLRLALVTRDSRLASVGEQPTSSRARSLANRVLRTGQPRSTAFDGLFLSARPVDANGRAVMVMLATTPTTLVDTSRASLFRTLFLIALGGTLLSLLLAALVGERIGARVRRLTETATAIREGDLSVRAGLDTDDEVGVLGSTFDAMASSIEEKTAALREAADDETRLRNRLEAIVGGMGEALVAVDARGRITDFNQAAEELVGVSAEAVQGRSAADIVKLMGEEGDDLSPRLRQPMARRWSAVGTLTPRIGRPVPVAVSAGALRGPARELAGGVFVLRDLRGEREVERMKTEFLSHVGHELRTPLAGVIGFTELLTRRQLPPEQAKPLQDDILTSAKRLERIVEMLEFFASTGAGRVMLRPEELDVRTLVNDVVARWSETVGSEHAITRRVARSLPHVNVDLRWMTRCLDELIDNAVKFSPQGGRVTVSAAASEDGRRVVISVTDRGKGMTPHEQASAFGAFVQGDGSDTRSFGGLGLGLALVQRVAEAHGGSVSVEAAPNKGATFSVAIPAVPIRGR